MAVSSWWDRKSRLNPNVPRGVGHEEVAKLSTSIEPRENQ